MRSVIMQEREVVYFFVSVLQNKSCITKNCWFDLFTDHSLHFGMITCYKRKKQKATVIDLIYDSPSLTSQRNEN